VAEERLQRALKQRTTSLAWERRADLVGRPLGQVGNWASQGSSQSPSDSAKLHDAETLSSYVADNEAMLKEELRTRVANAQAAVEHCQAAGPLPEQDWAGWFAENADAFQEQTRPSSEQRRMLSRRLAADDSMPEAAERLQPVAQGVATAKLQEWQRVLWGRTGFFGVAIADAAPRVFFLVTFHGATHARDLALWRQCRKRYALAADQLS